MGRRIGAYILDVVIALALMVVVFGLTADSESVAGMSCPDGFGTQTDNYLCVELGDTAYLYDTGDAWLPYLVGFAYGVAVYWILQGLTGRTPGKAVFGVRTVREDGSPPGVLKAFLRWLLMIVDGLCCGIVGLVLALTTKGHRRLGDMVASTFVVRGNYKGYVVIAGLNAPDANQFVVQQPVAGQPAPAAPQPQWDEARRAWIQWDPTGNRWMIYDQTSGQWTPMV